MRDPLQAFDWSSLYRKYDAECEGKYASNSKCLDRFEADRPATDRALYYRLVHCYSHPNRTTDPDVIGAYQAMLYWKLYSTGGSKGTNILKWLSPESKKRSSVESELSSLLTKLPATIPPNAKDIVKLVRELPSIPGMGTDNECRLPVRTTFLHFLYPSVVPIFDQMVLKAVGIEEKDANQDFGILERYLPFVWSLAEKYSTESSVCDREVPLRRIDMALWIVRDTV